MKLRYLGLSAAFALGLNGTMVMPAIVLAMTRIPGYDEGLATLVSSAELAGIAIYGLLLAGRMRSPLAFGLVFLLLGQGASVWLSNPAFLAIARLFAGLGEGAIFGVVAMQLAGSKDSEQQWGILNLIGGVAMGLLLLVVSVLAEQGHARVVFECIIAFAVLMMPLMRLMGRRAVEPIRHEDHVPMPRGRLIVTLTMVALIYGVQAGQWAICALIGEQNGLATGDVGFYLAISSVVGFAGAAVPALVTRKGLRLPAILIGLVAMGVSLHAFFNFSGAAVFVWAQIALNIGFYIVTPYLTGLLTEHDRDGTLVSRTLVIALFGAAAGTAIGGPVLATHGPQAAGFVFELLLAATAACGVLVFAPLHRAHARAQTDLQQ